MVPPTIRDARAALKAIEHIPRPDGDNEGDPINGVTVFPYLSKEHQALVLHAEEVVHSYARDGLHQPNRRAINAMTRNGFPAYLHPSQEDYDMMYGQVKAGEWIIDISDPQVSSSD